MRNLIGATNPVEAAPGTIRGDFAVELPYNIVHASDSPETAIAEIARFFGSEEEAPEDFWFRIGKLHCAAAAFWYTSCCEFCC